MGTIYQIKRGATIVLSAKLNGQQIRSVMAEDRVMMNFTLPAAVKFKRGDTVVAYGQTYKINRLPNDHETATEFGVRYELEFEALYYDLGKWKLRGLGPTNQLTQTQVDLRGNASAILDLVVRNANRRSSGWTVGVVDATDLDQFSYSGMSLLAVLQDLANRYSTEFWVQGKVINLSRRQVSSGLTLGFGMGKGLYTLSREKTDHVPINYLSVYGGTQNIPSTYGFDRLQLPAANRPALSVPPAVGEDVVEDDLFLENIFPTRKGALTGVSGELLLVDSTIDFNIPDYENNGKARIAFVSGQLTGFEFNIDNYNHATKQITIERIVTDKAYPDGVPNALLKAAVGDEYVLLNLDMPQSYITAAEAKLLAAGQKYFDSVIQDHWNYRANLTPIWVKQVSPTVELGYTAIIKSVGREIDKTVRISAYTRDLQEDYVYPQFTLSDLIEVSKYARELQSQREVQQFIKSSGSEVKDAETLQTVARRGASSDRILAVKGLRAGTLLELPDAEPEPADRVAGKTYMYATGDGDGSDTPPTMGNLEELQNVADTIANGMYLFKGSDGIWKGANIDLNGFATQSWVNSGFVPITRTVNGKALIGDIVLNAADVGALTMAAADGKYVSIATKQVVTGSKHFAGAIGLPNAEPTTAQREAGVTYIYAKGDGTGSTTPPAMGNLEDLQNAQSVIANGKYLQKIGGIWTGVDINIPSLAGYALESWVINQLGNYVPVSRTVNGKALSGNIFLTAADVGALSQSTADGLYVTLGTKQTIAGAKNFSAALGIPAIAPIAGDRVAGVTYIYANGDGSGSTPAPILGNLEDLANVASTIANGMYLFKGTDGIWKGQSISLAGYALESWVSNGFATKDHTHEIATPSANGFMSSADKTKLNGIATGANNYVHPAKAWVNKTALVGAMVLSNLTVDALGHPTDWTTRALVPADIGAAPAVHTHTFASLTAKPTTLVGYGITDGVTLNTKQSITGAKDFTGAIGLPGAAPTTAQRTAGVTYLYANGDGSGSTPSPILGNLEDLQNVASTIANGKYLQKIGGIWTGVDIAIPSLAGYALESWVTNGFAAKNDSRILNGQTAFGWGDHASANYWKLNYIMSAGAATGDADVMHPSGGFTFSYNSTSWLANSAFNEYGGLITYKGSGTRGALQFQYGVGHSGEAGSRIAFRTEYGTSGGNWRNWKELFHTGNRRSDADDDALFYTKSEANGRYLLLTGGDLTGNLRVNTNLWIRKIADAFNIDVSGIGYGEFNKIMLGRTDGTTLLQTGDGNTIWHSGNLTQNSINNWNTSYGWGDFRVFGLGSAPVSITSITDADRFNRRTEFIISNSTANVPFSQLGVGLNIEYSSVRNAQMWFNLGSSIIQVRTATANSVWSPSYVLWGSMNRRSDADDNARFVYKAGDTITGDLTVTGYAKFAFQSNVWYADNLVADRMYIGSANNANGILFRASQSSHQFQLRNVASAITTSINMTTGEAVFTGKLTAPIVRVTRTLGIPTGAPPVGDREAGVTYFYAIP